jgi:meso-butanediol dehydrogenase / (S,S)-butanediol dehydrogenase / diacetyl reductase
MVMLSPNRALVVGAHGDIGRALCDILLTRNLVVLGWDIRDRPDDLEVEWLTADVTEDTPGLGNYSEYFRERGALSHVFHVVGGTDARELQLNDPALVPLDVVDRTLRLNLRSAFMILNSTLPAIRQASGDRSYTFVSSINALGGYGAAAYSAAKSGLHGLVRALAVPLASEEIRINAVVFGTIETANYVRVNADAGKTVNLDDLGKRMPRGRILTPYEAAATLVTVGVDSPAVTGDVIVADAGQSIMRPVQGA